MAESLSFQEFLNCSICMERFTFPKMLPCQHTFCLSCLRGIVKDAKKLSCPQCRIQHKIPAIGVDGLPDNLTIKNLLDMFGVTAECNDCGKETSLTECGHCEQSVCAGCRMDHEQLVRDVQDKLRVQEGAADVPDDEQTNEKMKYLLDQIHLKQNRIPEFFDDRRQKLNQAQDDALSYFDILETKVKVIMREEKGTFGDSMQKRVSECKTTSSLKKLKAVLENTEMIMDEVQTSKDDKVTLVYMYDASDGCGRVSCGDKVVKIGRVGGGEEATSKLASEADLPSKVNYKAKKSLPKMYIERHPVAGKRIRPLCAVYCSITDSIYCISERDTKEQQARIQKSVAAGRQTDASSPPPLHRLPSIRFAAPAGSVHEGLVKAVKEEDTEGEVLVYGMGRGGSKVLSPLIQSARDLAITQSEKLVILESSIVSIIDLVPKIENVLLRREVFIPSACQVGTYGREFVVLNSDEKSLVFFTEEGERLRQVGIAGNITRKSKLAVAGDGRIYVTTEEFTVMGRNDNGEVQGCHGSKKSSVYVDVGQQVAVVPWGGGPRQTITICVGVYMSQYKFNKQCTVCNQSTARDDDSVPTDAQIIETNDMYIRGMCVDAEGFTTISVDTLTGLQVSDPEHDPHQEYDPHCVIKSPAEEPGSFLDPRGVALMPDGRLIVCDYGHNRIQIV